MNLKQLVEIGQYRFSELEEFEWDSFGHPSRVLSMNDPYDHSRSLSIVFCPKTLEVFTSTVYRDDNVFSWVSPKHEHTYIEEHQKKNLDHLLAWDDIPMKWVKSDEEFLAIAADIFGSVG